MKHLRAWLLVAAFLLICAIPMKTIGQTNSTTYQAAEFSSSGDLINGWYWLRDRGYEHSAQWIFIGLSPGTADFTLDLDVLATNGANGGPGVDAEFFLRYGIPPLNGHDGLLLGRKHIVLANAHDPADATGYSCRGRVTIPRHGLENSIGLWVIISRKDDLGELNPSNVHVAFRDASVILTVSAETGPLTLEGMVALHSGEFSSSGDFINDWYWLRDAQYVQSAQWVFTGLPHGTTDLPLAVEMLATDRVNGGPGSDADFFLSYGIPPLDGHDGLLLGRQEIVLPNAHDPADATGYICRDIITIPRDGLENATSLWVIVSRKDDLGELSPSNVHIAVHDLSLVLYVPASTGAGTLLSETDSAAQAAILMPGTFAGELGGLRADSQVDSEDWYAIRLISGQKLTLDLTQPGSGDFGLMLFAADSSLLTSGTASLAYVAGTDDILLIRINRHWGAGQYLLLITVANQNDALSGHDAGNTVATALKVSPGQFTGTLKAADNEDWYSIDLTRGQVLSVQLGMPDHAAFALKLYPPGPTGSNVGTTVSAVQFRSLTYAANMSGAWLIRVSRVMGEGMYELTIVPENQNDAQSGTDAGDDLNSAIPLGAGSFSGLLMRADDDDWYSLKLTQGQQLTLLLTSPENSGYGLRLYGPNAQSASGHIVTAGPSKTLSALIDETGIWSVRISRSYGKGEYQLAVSMASS